MNLQNSIRQLLRFLWSAGILSIWCSAPGLSQTDWAEQDRRATGWPDVPSAVRGFRMEGQCRRLGIDSRFTILFDRSGRIVETIDGPLGVRTGFDGRTAWSVDWNGMPRPLELKDAESLITVRSVWTGVWTQPDRPVDVGLDAAAPSSHHRVIRPKRGRLEARLAIGASTRLAEILTMEASDGESKWELSDYRSVAGLRLPYRVRHDTMGEEELFEVTRAEALTAFPDGAFRMPTARPRDTEFRSADSPVIEVRRTRSGHLLVQPMIDGQDVGWFILDSGAGSMVITPQAAEQTGMKPVGRVLLVGVGGKVATQFRTGGSFELGPMRVRGFKFIEADLGFLSAAFGVPIGGICGYDFFARAIVRIDVDKPAVSLYDPAEFRLPSARWDEVVYHGRNIAVRCKFEGGRSALFRIDTGAQGTLAFHVPAVREYKLLEGRETSAAQLGGVGGTLAAKRGRLKTFEIGGHSFRDALVEFAITPRGAFNDPYTAGNVGTAFLSPFELVFDLPNKRMAFVPRISGSAPAGLNAVLEIWQ